MGAGRTTGEGKRGRGRPESEPELLPVGASYAAWSAFHAPALEHLLRAFDAQQAEWEAYEQRCVAVVDARARGLHVDDPVPPSPTDSVIACLRWCAAMSPVRRAEVVRDLGLRKRPMPGADAAMPEIVMWIVGDALSGGIACDFETAYQAWFAIADRLLRDSDIGAIVVKVHPEKAAGRSPRLTEAEVKDLDARLASAERKRVNTKRIAFGYGAT